MIFDNLLSNIVQVETNNNTLSPVQFKTVRDNEQVEE